ncbi:DNA recombination and repair protein RecO [Alkalibacterium sp. AK22]|uniref:DNA repair protein RecO n=1 Tax=Alkalibacterium sp. AK22 TaxID=1229520 RepID=UPI0004538D50|nr:DNA repair protein RecO [Alkalibacterium sp. AK22]EXJ22467.1 DNA recombination and repair protein RecO [Alkalibacterium sp. AK22]
MAHLEEIDGLVLSVRKHRERDYLVKVFTDRYGKLMFFVRGTKKPNFKLRTAIQPFTHATFIADVRDEGLCFMRDAKDIQSYTAVQTDIFKNAYATYILQLADAALDDRKPDLGLFRQLQTGLEIIEGDQDPEIIMAIFEMRFMRYFGALPELRGCVICGKTEGAFDYSSRHHGLLCPRHFHEDERRLHASPKAIHFIRLFSVVSLEQINTITLKPETKKEIRQVIDQLYDELIGLNLKSKKFIDSMHQWEGVLKREDD